MLTEPLSGIRLAKTGQPVVSGTVEADALLLDVREEVARLGDAAVDVFDVMGDEGGPGPGDLARSDPPLHLGPQRRAVGYFKAIGCHQDIVVAGVLVYPAVLLVPILHPISPSVAAEENDHLPSIILLYLTSEF